MKILDELSKKSQTDKKLSQIDTKTTQLKEQLSMTQSIILLYSSQ